MDFIATFIVSLLFALLGIVIGFRVGQQIAPADGDRKRYWLRNLWVYLIGVAASALIATLGLRTLVFGAIGCMGGAIAGLKFGFGSSEGPWKVVDKALGVKNRHLERQGRPEGEEEPELMSVADPGKTEDRKTRRSR